MMNFKKFKLGWQAALGLALGLLVFTAQPVAAAKMVKDAVGKMVEEPQYGGWIDDTSRGLASPEWNPLSADWFSPQLQASYEVPLQIDWARGPAGTNEFAFNTITLILETLTGNIAESWERPDANRAIFKIRQGVHFWDKPPANGREMDAHDLVYSYNAMVEYPKSALFGSTNKYTALDKWTELYQPYLADVGIDATMIISDGTFSVASSTALKSL